MKLASNEKRNTVRPIDEELGGRGRDLLQVLV